MVDMYKVPTENALQYTLDAVLSQGATSLTLDTNVDNIVQAPGVLVIDRIDSNNNLTPAKREYITFTGQSGTGISGLSRGKAGSTDQEHAVGAIVEFMPDVVWAQSIYDAIAKEHSADGVHVSLPSVGGIDVREIVAKTRIKASAASVTGLVPVRPVWFVPGTISAATSAIGRPVPMPESGNIDFINVILRSPISAASLVIDINKNFSSILADSDVLSILGGGTFVSTASIATPAFSRGDMMSVDLEDGGWFEDMTIIMQGK